MSLHISISRSVRCRFSRLNRSNWKCLWAVQAPCAQCRDKREGQLTLIPQDSWPLILFSVLLWNENNNILMDKAVATFISLLEGVSFKRGRLNSDLCVLESYSWGKHTSNHWYKWVCIYTVCLCYNFWIHNILMWCYWFACESLIFTLIFNSQNCIFPMLLVFARLLQTVAVPVFSNAVKTHLTFLIGLGRETLQCQIPLASLFHNNSESY